jgi:hypothetical protein
MIKSSRYDLLFVVSSSAKAASRRQDEHEANKPFAFTVSRLKNNKLVGDDVVMSPTIPRRGILIAD